jgi:hypothetical protein
MRIQYNVTLAMLAGFGLGAVAVQGLHAQAKPPVYQVVEAFLVKCVTPFLSSFVIPSIP